MMLNPDVTFSRMLLHVSFVIDCILLIVLFKSISLGHLSNSGDLLLWVGVRRALTSSSQELLGQSKPSFVCSIRRVRRQEIKYLIDIK